MRIIGCLLDEALHAGRERVVGVVQQDIALLECCEHVGRLGGFDLGKMRMSRWQERRVLEFGTIEIG